MDNYDAVVIGAGPAGSTTAKQIADAGYSVCMIEKDGSPGQSNVCAGGFPKFILKNLGLGPEIIEKTITGTEHYFPWGLDSRSFQEKDYHATSYRSVLDKAIAEKAVASGAELRNTTIASDVIKKNNIVYTHVENLISKDKSIIESDLIIFADGPNTLARKFNIGFIPRKNNTAVSIVCEVEWAGNPSNNYELYFDPRIAKWGYGWIFPRKNTANVGLGCLYSESDDLMKSLNYLMNEHPVAKKKLIGRKICFLRSSIIPAEPASRIFDDSILVVGDAAGMVDPITGGGIAHSIQGGIIAGNIAVKALEEKNFSHNFLSQYQKEWEKTGNFRLLKQLFIDSRIFQSLSKIDKHAYSKLFYFAGLQQGPIGLLSNPRVLLYK